MSMNMSIGHGAASQESNHGRMGCYQRKDGIISECRHSQSISIEIYHLTTVKERERSGIM